MQETANAEAILGAQGSEQIQETGRHPLLYNLLNAEAVGETANAEVLALRTEVEKLRAALALAPKRAPGDVDPWKETLRQRLPLSGADAPLTQYEELTLEETGYAPVRRIPASRRPAHPVHTSKGVKGKGNGERYIKGDWMKGEPIVVRQHNEHRCWRQERNERTGEIMDVHICESCGWVSCTLHRSIKPPRGWVVIP